MPRNQFLLLICLLSSQEKLIKKEYFDNSWVLLDNNQEIFLVVFIISWSASIHVIEVALTVNLILKLFNATASSKEQMYKFRVGVGESNCLY